MNAVGELVNIDELEDIDWEEDNNDSKEEFEANYVVYDENDDGDLAGNPAVQNEVEAIVSQHPFNVLSFMRTLDLEVMHVPKFFEYANIGEGDAMTEDGDFSVGMEFEFATKRVEESFQRAENIVVNRFDRRNEMFEVREIGEFVPMDDPSMWDRYKGAKMIANWTLRRTTKRRPKSTRYLNEIDSRDMCDPRRCTICGREGHSCSRCPQRGIGARSGIRSHVQTKSSISGPSISLQLYHEA
ncbi:hypothetical protein Ahy_B08g090210 [Arachis hypogaea]|uniref:CCHC-type domain-containing protein n=1 Tax=Arachis hypogaea TaxID=3818 RepID=A0A444XZP4_ARAHY|nr:hypothetical protein Ahy_B08g090210 [Arachis hypogaea]